MKRIVSIDLSLILLGKGKTTDQFSLMLAQKHEPIQTSFSPSSLTNDVSRNTILGGRVQLLQPKVGYRASIDALFLAASVTQSLHEDTKTKPNTSCPYSVLDIGTGAGTALLALASRLPHITGVGLEFQREMVRLANQNIANNHFQDRLDVMQGDLTTPPPRLAAGSFAHVMANPPYYESQSAIESPQITKAISNHDKGVTLEQWVDFACRMLKPKGYAYFVFTAARLDDLLDPLYGRFGGITIFPLWSKAGREAKRIIVRARKNVKSDSRVLPGMVVHDDNGDYTPAANDILVNAKGINWG